MILFIELKTALIFKKAKTMKKAQITPRFSFGKTGGCILCGR
jgi:hypothetical protein